MKVNRRTITIILYRILWWPLYAAVGLWACWIIWLTLPIHPLHPACDVRGPFLEGPMRTEFVDRMAATMDQRGDVYRRDGDTLRVAWLTLPRDYLRFGMPGEIPDLPTLLPLLSARFAAQWTDAATAPSSPPMPPAVANAWVEAELALSDHLMSGPPNPDRSTKAEDQPRTWRYDCALIRAATIRVEDVPPAERPRFRPFPEPKHAADCHFYAKRGWDPRCGEMVVGPE